MSSFTDILKTPVKDIFKSVFGGGGTKSQPVAYGGGGVGRGSAGYGGAQVSGGKWPFGLSAPGSGVVLDHWSLRQGARVAMQESPQGRAIVERKIDAVAYTGLKLEPTPDVSVLGITNEESAMWSKDVAGRFDLYSRDKKQHRSELLTFYQSHRLVSYFIERDNDYFVRYYYSTDKKLQNPLQFEFLDPDQIRGQSYTSSYGVVQCTEDGIIRDERNRETGYKVWIKKKDGTLESVDIMAKGPKSGRIFMIHGFRPEYAGQGRGFTKLAPIIQDLENFTDFSSSHIKKAINQASFVGWIEPSVDEDTIPIFDENSTTYGAGPAGDNFSGEEPAASTDSFAPPGNFSCYDMPEATTSIPGSFFGQALTKGSKIKLADQNAPITSYDKFQDAFLTSLSSVSGTPLEVVHMKFGNNYSASRATLLLYQRVVEIERDDMVADYLNPHYEMWMSGEIAAGRIMAPGWSDPRLRAAWLKSSWRGTPVPDIDPDKLAKAYMKHIEMGIDSAETISQTHSGKSATDNISSNNLVYKDYEPPPFSAMAIAEESSESSDDDEGSN